ncbi:family 20 glycosylhydrolase [Chitinophaga sp. SYP-B3965]|uniref:family 20 glycosylhydrolase n=1 Tax=Chitinophaga sp. SYP-B3965 TaxID=2663120 RepID=UPI00129962B4|nr:family 20 glycosylhydrolase [Chitinophaga sp. SYP-B3965]MRG45986.1 family 20 glycosylhydrolase [Chitinophaga sp. SYP-B3965]
MKKTLLFAFMALACFTGLAQQKQPVLSIIPEPRSVEMIGGQVTITPQMKYFANSEAAQQAAEVFVQFVASNYNFVLEKGTMQNSTLVFSEDDALPAEGYQLTVARNKIVLQGRAAGMFYGVQTLQQIMPLKPEVKAAKNKIIVPGVTIKDEPRFAYRGFMLDVGRHFFDVNYIRKLIQVMAFYKLNRLHWHLTEDQGWRIEIKKYPKLQSVASQRKETMEGPYRDGKYDGKPYGGYYTQEEVKQVVAYAAKFHITVIPEIEMPGHALAALAAYPQLGCTGGPYEVATKWGVHKEVFCAGNDEVFTFLEDVLTEVIPLFPGQYIHIGGDECPKDRWKTCPKCQARMKALGLKDEHALQSYFIQRMEKFLNSKGKKIIGWDEILEGGLAPDATVMSWRGEAGGIEAAKQKHDVIMTPNTYLYLDYNQGNPATEPLAIGGYLPLEKVYSYEPYPAELTEEQKKYITGVQGNLWTEYIPTEKSVDYFAFPRAIAMAEIAWSPQNKKDYTRFMNSLPRHLALWDDVRLNFRIPEPQGLADEVMTGANTTVTLKPSVAYGTIRYTLDGSEPAASSTLYTKPIVVTAPSNGTTTLKLIVITPSGRASSVYSATYMRKDYKTALNINPTTKGVKFDAYFKTFKQAKNVGEGKADSTGVLPAFDIRPFTVKPAFGVRYEGYVKIETDGLYEFKTNSDDGSILAVDDEVIVDNDGEHAPTDKIGMIPLRKGFHKISVKYFDAGGGKQLQVSFGPKGKQSVNLRNALFH